MKTVEETPETIELLGSWTLIRVEHLLNATPPELLHVDEDKKGFIHYMADGRVAVLIAGGDHQPVNTGMFNMSETDQASCYRSFNAYGGTFSRTGNRVVHHLDICSYPDDTGTDYVRTIDVEDGNLVLNASTEKNGKEMLIRLFWQRI